MTTHQKTCFKCGVEKLLTEFYIHPQMADGHLNKCKDCTRRDVRNARSEKNREYDRRRYAERKHEHKARMAVNAAVARGDLERPEACWHCGEQGDIEGHHADYKNPLGVVFLCRDCHSECHRLTTALNDDSSYGRRMLRMMGLEKAA